MPKLHPRALREIDWDAPVDISKSKGVKLKSRPLEYSQIIDGLYQGSAPSPGPDAGKKFDALVLMAHEHQPTQKEFPGIEVLQAGIWDARPSGQDIQKAYKAAQWVATRLKAGKKVLVTCMAGLNRSGMVSAMSLIMMGYPPKNAMALVKNARGPKALSNKHFNQVLLGMKQVTNEEIIREAIRTLLEAVELLPYSSSRDYSKAEMEVEVGEYFENSTTRSTMPDLFSSPEDARQKIKAAETAHLSESDMMSLQNSDIAEVLRGGGLKAAREVAEQNGRDIDSIIAGIEESEAIPPPIIVRDKNGSNYLLGGNTRLMTAVAMGLNPLVKVLDYIGTFRLDA
jgi:hypothetical protein